ncbi:hypothetical protein KFK14_23875 [Sphingobium phenoxybenzoativorans]|uniref:DUF4124 domain-containing protein n=1 Tax=Sphingobium phenoxybenzoativorans TaxID=1592790 RepID=A0A975K702_9SPHN|nr:hypothetical protein [Sphingobium phenoxybenzoativorans]QUT05930.1 hypothetical protein KFK14_23875 [Sphingobium phenoxybenzoativorans]
MKIALPAALALCMALTGAPALAQEADAAAGPPPGGEKVNLVIVYGDDACPESSSGDIVVCARKEEQERYRIPEPLRGDPNAPAKQAWGERAKSIEYVGKSGTESCSPAGSGGTTGCFNRLAQMARAERKQADNASWNDLVAAEREKRLAKIDAESEAIEQRVKAEEAAKAKADAEAGATPAPQ